jgi:hypothetical protein
MKVWHHSRKQQYKGLILDKLRAREVENILGIYSPFYIKDIRFDNERCTIQLDEIGNKNKSIASRFRTSSKQKTYSWKHVKFGRLNTVIEFKSTESNFNRLTKLVCPAFLGNEDSEYTKQAQDIILFAHNKKLDADTISTLTGLNLEDIKKFILDNENSQITKNTSSLLPLETDAIWIRIIKRESPLKTSLTPLRMLLHKLELTEINSENGNTLQESVSTLRAFFIKNKANLVQEYQQIGAKPDLNNPLEKTITQSKKSNSLTPSHPVWDNILTEKFSLMSSNLAFNLYISRLKSLYNKELSVSEKRDIIIELMKYLKKNINSLRTELISIKRIAETIDTEPKSNKIPNKDHSIWQEILTEKFDLNSNRLNLNLLLVKLKSQVSRGMEQESCYELQQFFNDNYRSLSREIEALTETKSHAV